MYPIGLFCTLIMFAFGLLGIRYAVRHGRRSVLWTWALVLSAFAFITALVARI